MGSEHFDRVADTYARGRPPYPERLWDLLSEHGVLSPGARLLEVGAGSGQATAELVARGAAVDAVEPGPNLASELRRRVPGVPVTEARVEDVALPEGRYDAVVAATSFHWLDRLVALARLHRTLRPDGRLAVWWTVFGDPTVRTPFRDRVQEISNPAGRPDTRRTALETHAWEADLAEGGWFRPRATEVLRWTIELTADQLRDLFATFPTWTDEQIDQIGAAAHELGGRVVEHYVTVLYVLDRVER